MCTVADLNHSWNGTHQEWDNGKMDGFTAANVDPLDPNGSRTMGYFDQTMLPFYYGLANQFSIADHYFASVLTQTFPNRFYLLTGTSFGHIRNDSPPKGGWTQKTVFQLLDQKKISWKIYLALGPDRDPLQLRAEAPQPRREARAVLHRRRGREVAGGVVHRGQPGRQREHRERRAPARQRAGRREVHARRDAGARVEPQLVVVGACSSRTTSTAATTTTSPPPKAVKPDNIPPMLKPGDDARPRSTAWASGCRRSSISPYAKTHFVSHTVYDHTSILRFIEKRFGLPNLTNRDKAANPMLGMFDFTKVSNPSPTLPDAPIDPAQTAICAALHP